MDPQDIIRILGMQPHPEGGWYKETFRDPAGGGRGHSTAIYYLLQAGERSHWHRVRDRRGLALPRWRPAAPADIP